MSDCCNQDDELLENWPRERAVRRDTLLENWPTRRTSVVSEDEVDDRRRHRVKFSNKSQLNVYERHPIPLLQSLTYSKEDRDEFGREAALEGLRIKNLIATAPPDSPALSIKYLIQNDIISKAELIGIEHFILGKCTRVLKVRRDHSRAVLKKQNELWQQKLEDPALNLGKFAQLSSLKSTHRARIRAAVAA